MDIFPIPALKDNYIWALLDKSAKKVLIVDPGEAQPVKDFLQQYQYTLAGILITHHHWDHTDGIADLKKQFDVPVVGPEKDHIPELTICVHEKDKVRINDFPITFEVMEIPGHTLGHIAYYSPGMLFCGDTLFAAGCGRVFEGTPKQMYATLQKIAALPETTKIYCAHEYTLNNLRFAEKVEPGNAKIKTRLQQINELRKNQQPSLPSTLKEEKETNPFLRCDSKELIASVAKHAGKELHDGVDVFTCLRQWKDGFG